jgi:hypothetical protein
VSGIARDLESFRRALHDVELDEREVSVLVEAASTWDLTTVEVICSLFEKVREAGYLSAPATTEGFIRKDPGRDWGWADSSGGSAYTGRNGDDAGNADTP